MIHVEAEKKRKDGDQPDRVEGRIESFLQSRARSRWQTSVGSSHTSLRVAT